MLRKGISCVRTRQAVVLLCPKESSFSMACAIVSCSGLLRHSLRGGVRVQGRLLEAVEAYERALAAAPNYEIVRNNLAIALTELGTRTKMEGRRRCTLPRGHLPSRPPAAPQHARYDSSLHRDTPTPGANTLSAGAPV